MASRRSGRSTRTSSLLDARDRFAHLIEINAPEKDFQRLFSNCPFIFSESLPLRMTALDIRAMGTPGRSEPDFVFYPESVDSAGEYGVIEIKRPDSRILTTTRKNIVTLSRDAETAISQCEHYLNTMALGQNVSEANSIVLGAKGHVFVVMGMVEELKRKLLDEFTRKQIERRIPSNCQLIPYDVLLEIFTNQVRTRVSFFVPAHKEIKRIYFMDGGLRNHEKEIGGMLIDILGILLDENLLTARFERMEHFADEIYERECDAAIILMNPIIDELESIWDSVCRARAYSRIPFLFITNPAPFDPTGVARTARYLRPTIDTLIGIPFRIIDLHEFLAKSLR